MECAGRSEAGEDFLLGGRSHGFSRRYSPRAAELGRWLSSGYHGLTLCRDKWWPAAKARVARSTAATWRSELDNHVLPALSSRRLALVRVEDIDDLYRRRAEDGAAHASIMKLRSVLSNIWTEARRLGYADSSPIELSRVPTRRSNRSDEVVFTLNEVRGIADGASRIWGGYAGPILIAAGAGLRWGEMAALTPEDVDLDGGLIRVNKSLSETAGHFEVKEPKSRAGDRVTAHSERSPR